MDNTRIISTLLECPPCTISACFALLFSLLSSLSRILIMNARCRLFAAKKSFTARCNPLPARPPFFSPFPPPFFFTSFVHIRSLAGKGRYPAGCNAWLFDLSLCFFSYSSNLLPFDRREIVFSLPLFSDSRRHVAVVHFRSLS